MKHLLVLCFLLPFLGFCQDDTKYFDEDNNPISKEAFFEKRNTNRYLDVPGDSAHHKKLLWRYDDGKINNLSGLQSVLSEVTGRKIEEDKPILILYYPGKDQCNSTGTWTRSSIKRHREQLEKKTMKLAGVTPYYFYRDSEGLDKYGGGLTWYADPEKLFQNLFFKHPYPCGSFVVISHDGYYLSYFGEYSHNLVLDALAAFMKDK